MRIKERWSFVQVDELECCRNDFDLLSCKLQECTHESKEVVRNFVDNLWFEIYVRGTKQGVPSFELQP